VGDVEIGPHSVVWPGATLRAESAKIKIGNYSTIFDGVVMFTKTEKSPINIGNYNIIDTGSFIFGTFMEDYVQIGENTVLYEGSSIGEGSIILKDSIIVSGMVVAERAIMKGNPASTIREQSRQDVIKQKERAEHYSDLFIRVHKKLPNLQPYALTKNDLMKLLMDHFQKDDEET